jgi:hypothetical protein
VEMLEWNVEVKKEQELVMVMEGRMKFMLALKWIKGMELVLLN